MSRGPPIHSVFSFSWMRSRVDVAEHHRAEAAVAERQRLVPLARRMRIKEDVRWRCWAAASDAVAQERASNVLFYTHPAREWNQALPLGNGRLGAMVFGNVNAERIQLNENSLWMGGPRDTNNPDALKHLAEVRRLLFAGLPVEAYAVAEKYSMGRPFRLESYQSLGDLRLDVRARGHARQTIGSSSTSTAPSRG